MPAMVLRSNFAIAIRAPVLPAEIATSASPFFTASMASHIDDFHRPARSAWLGLSSILIATSVWTRRDAASRAGLACRSGPITAASPNRANSTSARRASDSAAPGTTTDAPWSPPMASSAIRTFSGMDYPGLGLKAPGKSVLRERRPAATRRDHSVSAAGHKDLTSGNDPSGRPIPDSRGTAARSANVCPARGPAIHDVIQPTLRPPGGRLAVSAARLLRSGFAFFVARMKSGRPCCARGLPGLHPGHISLPP